MNEQEVATNQRAENESSSSTVSLAEKKESYQEKGLICVVLFLAVAFINGLGITTGAFVDTVQTGLLVGAIVCYVAAARVKPVE